MACTWISLIWDVHAALRHGRVYEGFAREVRLRDEDAVLAAAPAIAAAAAAAEAEAAAAADDMAVDKAQRLRRAHHRREAAERTAVEAAYGLQPNELREAAEAGGGGGGGLTPLVLCHALAAKKGFQMSRNGGPDAHRAGLLLVRDCADGALLFASRPPGAQ